MNIVATRLKKLSVRLIEAFKEAGTDMKSTIFLIVLVSFLAGCNPTVKIEAPDCTSSEHVGPLEPFSKRHFSARTFSSLAC